ncbi:hypothetical protein JAAARDRAFT_32581 [Jaapia argillacea MUCL 33604]|uniref:Uncharacterized protein n=1 Tax=Jaapia argillacea MUCL 33604 TaxID=933084 RepID=A0A067Q9L7_9AGAM|nr:hypothetical protein JAAARDRAFT_32581 [Jaapia argillacea MUCL 33604]
MTVTEPPGWWKPKPAAHHTILPPEIWLSIFHLATTVPQALDTDFRDPFELPSPSSSKQVGRSVYDSLVTKRYLVRVCKDWYQLASRFLYREVVIGRGRTLVSLRSTLLESQRRAEEALAGGDEVRSLGWYTLRFELATRTCTSLEDMSPLSELLELIDIFRCLPNLQILIVIPAERYYPPWPVSVLSSLGSHCGQSLRVIRWCRHPCPSASEWTRLLRTTPNLRVLRFPTYHDHIQIGGLKLGTALPQLASIERSSRTQHFLQTTSTDRIFPSLQHLSISASRPPMFLLTPYGSQLTCVTITALRDDRALHRITDSCPNLHKMVICLQVPDRLPGHLPNITHLGLRFDMMNVSKHTAEGVFLGLTTMDAPNLEVLRFLDRVLLDRVRERQPKVFNWAVELLSECRYRIEDCNGVAIDPRFGEDALGHV